jgi:peroxiredoxin
MRQSLAARSSTEQKETTMAGLDVGMKAPDFTLASTIGDPVSLSEVLKEKNAVLVFYVLAFSSV